MTPPRTFEVAGWTISLLEPAGSGTAVACSQLDASGTIAAGLRWVDLE